MIAAAVDVARRGRPRSKEREREILAAALHALVTEGFDAMTIEGVAAAAGAGKATVYRRWHNKIDLVIDAIREQVALRADIVDTGDIGADMRSFLTQLQCDLLGPNGALLATFMAERLRHPSLAQAFEEQYVSQKRAQLRRLVRRLLSDRHQLPAGSLRDRRGIGRRDRVKPAELERERLRGRERKR